MMNREMSEKMMDWTKERDWGESINMATSETRGEDHRQIQIIVQEYLIKSCQ